MKAQTVLTGVVLAALLGGLSWLAPADRDTPASLLRVSRSPASAPGVEIDAVAEPAAATAAASTLPFPQDESGALQVDAGMVPALEWLCRTPGAAPDARLAPAARQQLLSLRAQYCRYLDAATAITASPPATPQDAQRQLVALMALRRRFFDGETAERLFGVEEQLAAHTLAAVALEQDATLTATEKSTRLAALRQALPVAVAALDAPQVPYEQTLLLQAAAGDEVRQQLQRTQEIAAQWAQRHADYAVQKRQILAAGLSDDDKASQIEALLRRHYLPDELAAARAYDRQHGPVSVAAESSQP